MATVKTSVAFPYKFGTSVVRLPADFGATGKTSGDIGLITKSVEGASFGAVSSYTLSELGNNLYTVNLSGVAVSAANSGLNLLLVSGASIDRNEINFYLHDKISNDLYDDLNAATLKVSPANNSVDANAIAASAITAGKFAAGAIDAAALNADAGAEIADAVWDEDVSTHTGGSKAGEFQANVATLVWASGARTLTSLGTLAQDVWDVLTANITTASSIGVLIKTNLDAVISAIETKIDAIKTKTDGVTFDAVQTSAVVSAPVTAISMSSGDKDDIVDRVWDEAASSHVAAGTIGKIMRNIRGYVTGKRKIINVGANEEMYDEDNVTLLNTFTITRDGNDKITERST